MNKQTVSGLKPKQLLRKLASKMPTVWDQIKAFRKAQVPQHSPQIRKAKEAFCYT